MKFKTLNQIIKIKLPALKHKICNDPNTRIEDDLYNEVLRKIKTLPVNRPVVKNEEHIPTRKIFIDHVLSNEMKFTDTEVRDHVSTMVSAGSETTGLQTAHTSEKFMHI
jgi:cytochrome P450